MSIAENNNRERLEDLLLQRAVFGLDPPEQSELERLLSGTVAHDSLAFENVIGALDAGWAEEDSLKDGFEPLPEYLKSAILSQATAGEANRVLTTVPPPLPQARTSGSASAWTVREKLFGLATAASLAVALFSVYSRLSGEPPLSEQWAMLESSAPDLVKPDWTVASEELAKGVTGSVIWSDQKQQGFMKFRGLARNQTDRQQYQLWIFDANRSDDQPVDGGVFDIAADGEVIVPIEAKLDVSSAKMFAITIERPGGVVVSDRSKLPLLAKVQR
jgi:anti-sigma-K factor RskA